MKALLREFLIIGLWIAVFEALSALPSHAQIMVSMDLVTNSGAAASNIGRGLGAYPWNLHVCGLGPQPVPFSLVRINFPEVRFYDPQQQVDILASRSAHSIPARALRFAGFLGGAAGVGITIEQKLNKSPSWLGPALTPVSLAIPLVQSLITPNVPKYAITNPVPDTISLQLNQCSEFTALAMHGSAAVTVGPRRIDPLPQVIK